MNSLTKIFLAAVFPIANSSFAKTAPNFIILYVDDLGYADIGSYGGDRARTPELDRMAKLWRGSHRSVHSAPGQAPCTGLCV